MTDTAARRLRYYELKLEAGVRDPRFALCLAIEAFQCAGPPGRLRARRHVPLLPHLRHLAQRLGPRPRTPRGPRAAAPRRRFDLRIRRDGSVRAPALPVRARSPRRRVALGDGGSDVRGVRPRLSPRLARRLPESVRLPRVLREGAVGGHDLATACTPSIDAAAAGRGGLGCRGSPNSAIHETASRAPSSTDFGSSVVSSPWTGVCTGPATTQATCRSRVVVVVAGRLFGRERRG